MPLPATRRARRAALLGALALPLGCDSSEPPLGPSETLAGRIVFGRGGAPTSGVYSMRPDGSDVQPVANLTIGNASPDWRRQLFIGASGPVGPSCLAVSGADGVERLTSVCGEDVRNLAWSPNGERLAARAGDSVYVLGFVREQPIVVGAALAPGYGGLAWAPDGGRLAMAVYDPADPDLTTYLVTMSADARSLSTIANVALGTGLAWSPDGAWIVARSGGVTGANAVRLYGPNGGLAGRELVPPTEVVANWGFVFSPDGSHLAIVGNRPGTGTTLSESYLVADVFVVRVADGALARVTPRSGVYTGMVWSPDGDRLAYSGTPGGSRHPEITNEIFVVQVPAGSTPSAPVAITATPDVGETVTAWF